MEAKIRGIAIRSPGQLTSKMKSVSLAVTMEGDVVMNRGKNGMDYATGVGVGMGGDRVAFMFFGEAMDKAGNCLRGGCSCSGSVLFFGGVGNVEERMSVENCCEKFVEAREFGVCLLLRYIIRGGLVKIKHQTSVGGPSVPVDVIFQKYLEVDDIAANVPEAKPYLSSIPFRVARNMVDELMRRMIIGTDASLKL